MQQLSGNGILNDQVSGEASGSERAKPGTVPGQGGEINNMPPSISHEGDSGGLDALSVSLYGRTENPESCEAWFDEGQQTAREIEEEQISVEDGQTLIHHKSGGHAAGIYCPYRVEFKGVVFMVSRRWNSATDSFPTMQANVKSMPLMIHGYARIKAIIYEFAELIGFEITSTRINRVDLCVDLKIPMQEFQQAFFEKRIVAAPRKGCIYFDRSQDVEFETLQFGVKDAPIKIRMYNKVAECRHQEKKCLVMQALRWQGEIPEAATRVEYQLRGEWLSQQFSTITLEQFEQNIGSIVEYLTTHWFRIVDHENDQKHYDRMQLSPLWQRVQDAFKKWSGPALTARQKRVKLVPKNEAMVQQVKGCLKTIFALNGWVPSTFGLFVTSITDLFKEEYNSFVSDCADRRRLVETRYGDVFNLFPECLEIKNPKDERAKIVRL